MCTAIMMFWTIFQPLAFWNMNLSPLLNDGNWLNIHVGYILKWFAPKCTTNRSHTPIKMPRVLPDTSAIHIRLHDMFDLWNRHCTPLCLCMYMAMNPEHLCTEHGNMLLSHPIHYLSSRMSTLLSHSKRHVRKLSDLMCLARHGSHDQLEEGKTVCS